MNRLAVLTGIVALLVSATGCTALPPPSAAEQRTPDVAATIDAAANDQLHRGVIGSIISLADPVKGTYLNAFGTSDMAGSSSSEICQKRCF